MDREMDTRLTLVMFYCGSLMVSIREFIITIQTKINMYVRIYDIVHEMNKISLLYIN